MNQDDKIANIINIASIVWNIASTKTGISLCGVHIQQYQSSNSIYWQSSVGEMRGSVFDSKCTSYDGISIDNTLDHLLVKVKDCAESKIQDISKSYLEQREKYSKSLDEISIALGKSLEAENK